MTPDELRAVAARAMTLDERARCSRRGECPLDDRASSRLERWRGLFPDESAFASRLARLNIDSDQLPMILGSEEWPSQNELHAWTELLQAVVSDGALEHFGDGEYRRWQIADRRADQDGTCDLRSAICHLEGRWAAVLRTSAQRLHSRSRKLLAPFVDVATAALLGRTAEACILDAAALAMLQRSLLAMLANVAVRPLMLEFSIFRALEQPIVIGANGSALYAEFVRRTLRDPARLFGEYSELARLLSVASQQWLDNLAVCLLRLKADAAAIESFFDVAIGHPHVVAARTMLSDPHAGGQTVVALRLAGGADLIYKPRDVGQEFAFNHLLQWLNSHGAPARHEERSDPGPRVLRLAGAGRAFIRGGSGSSGGDSSSVPARSRPSSTSSGRRTATTRT